MNEQTLDSIISGYMSRIQSYQSFRTASSFSGKWKTKLTTLGNERKKSIARFISDAFYLASIDFEKEKPVKGLTSKTKFCPQYFLLERANLVAYFGFRTALRKGISPTYPDSFFISLYLMEILNGIYSRNTADIEKELDRAFQLLLPAVGKSKMKRFLLSAYRNLYFLYGGQSEELNRLEKKTDMQLFPETVSQRENIISFSYLYKVLHLKDQCFDSAILFLMEECYLDLAVPCISEGFYGSLGYLNDSSELFAMEDAGSPCEGAKPLYVDFPVLPDFSIPMDDQVTYEVHNGRLREVVMSLSYDCTENCRIYLQLLGKVLTYCCGGPRNILENFSQRENDSYFAYYAGRREKNQDTMLKVVMQWVSEHPYAKKAYGLTPEELKARKHVCEFSINLENVAEIRKDSAVIQDRLIVEDEETVKKTEQEKPEEARTYFLKLKDTHSFPLPEGTAKGKNKFTEEGSFLPAAVSDSLEALAKAFTPDETQVVSYLCGGDDKMADAFCRSHGLMLNLMVEQINEKALTIYDDVLIEDNSVLDEYRGRIGELVKEQGKL